jgi:hypothetical protein
MINNNDVKNLNTFVFTIVVRGQVLVNMADKRGGGDAGLIEEIKKLNEKGTQTIKGKKTQK